MSGKKQDRKIVLVNQVTGYLFIDIANELAKKYDKIVLLTGIVRVMEHPLNEKMQVTYIKKYSKKSTVTRMTSWFIAFVQIFFLVKTRYRKYDLFISSNPPLATLLPAFCKSASSLLIYDIYPDAIVATNLLNDNNFVIKFWKKLNRAAYKNAKNIITLTEGMSNLLEQYVDKSRISVVPVWASNMFFSNKSEIAGNIFVEKNNLENKFLVVYSGNLGKEYELETLVHVAHYLKDKKQVMFLIIGSGWKKEKLQAMVTEYNLCNCMILPYQSPELFTHLMNAMNIGVVSLGNAASQIGMPSKTYNILASGKPLLCIGSKNSDLAALIGKHQVGNTFAPDEISEIAKFIEAAGSDNSEIYATLCSNAKKTSLLFTSDNAKKIADLVAG